MISGKTTIIIAGGKEDDNTDLKVVEQLGENDTNCQIPNLPSEVSGNPSMFKHQGNIILCGGYPNKKQCLMLNYGTWSHLNELIYHRTFATLISTQKRNYIFGGGESRYTSEYLESGSHQWQRGPNIPLGMRFGCGVGISDTELVLIGGQGTLDRVIKLNISSNVWIDLPVKLTQGRYYHACALFESKIIVAGGLGNGGLLSSTEIVDVNSWTLSLGECLTSAKFNHGMAIMTWNNSLKLISFGGKKGSNEYLDVIEIWNNNNNTWSTIQNFALLQPKANFGYTSISDSYFHC